MRKFIKILLWGMMLCLMASPAFGVGITDKSIGGLIDVLEDGATTQILMGGGGSGNIPLWKTVTGTGTTPVMSISPTLTGTMVVDGIDGSGTISGNLFTPDAADGADIGSAALEFSDIYLADGSIIKFQNDQSVTLTSSAAGLAVNLILTVGTSVDPDTANGAALGGTSKEWSDLYLAAGGIIYGENDQGNRLTSGAAGWTANLNIEAATLTEGGENVPNVTDNLSVFASTTSSQLSGVISDETGTLKFVLSDSPVFTTKITTPKIDNAAAITIESTGAGVNIELHSDAGDDFKVDTDKFVVEGDSGNIGIGTASPEITIHIKKSGNAIGFLIENDQTSNDDQFFFASYDTASGDHLGTAGDEFQIVNLHGAGGDVTAFAIDTNANILIPNGAVGINDNSPSYKLEVNGTAHVIGEFTAGTKTFKIDHPTLPTDKFLLHATVEAPRHDLIYRGIVTLKDGKATVNIDSASGMTAGTFAALCQNVVVTNLQNQVGFDRVKPGPVSGAIFEIISENALSIDKISWVVMAERKDPLVKWSDQNDEDGRLIVEVDKVAPTADELKVLEKKVVETEDTELIGTTVTKDERIDSLKEKKGYLMQPECRGTTRPYRAIEYKARTAEK